MKLLSRRTAMFCLAALLCAGCNQQTHDTEVDEEAIRAWLDRYVANNNAGDFDAYGGFWAEDATWLPPDAPLVEGREAILDYARPFFEGYTISQRFAVEEIEVADRFAFARVNSTERYTPTADAGEPLDLSVKAIFILRRKPDGSWVATHCVWNNNAPPSQ